MSFRLDDLVSDDEYDALVGEVTGLISGALSSIEGRLEQALADGRAAFDQGGTAQVLADVDDQVIPALVGLGIVAATGAARRSSSLAPFTDAQALRLVEPRARASAAAMRDWLAATDAAANEAIAVARTAGAASGGGSAVGRALTTADVVSTVSQFNRARVGSAIEGVARATVSQSTTATLRVLGGAETKTWITVGDTVVRDEHAALDGTTVLLDEPFDVGGYLADGPLDPSLPPHLLYNCRCGLEYGAGLEDDGTTDEELGVDDDYDPDRPRRGMGDEVQMDTARLGENDTAAGHVQADGSFTPERQALHDQIIRDTLDGYEPQASPEFMFMGGGSGAGKTTAIKSGAVDVPRGAVTLNADDFKELLPEVDVMKAAGDTRWAARAHVESSHLVQRATVAAQERRLSTVLDATGSDAGKVLGKVEAARAAGYRVRASYVTIPPEEGVARVIARGQRSGRVVPTDVVRSAHHGANSSFRQVAGAVDEAVLVDNTVKPVVVARYQGGRLVVEDQALWDDFLTRGGTAT